MEQQDKSFFHDGNPFDENDMMNIEQKLHEKTAETDNLSVDDNADEMPTEKEGKNELQLLQENYDALNDKYLRLNADFDNYRKRTLKEKAELIRNGGEKLLSEILPLIDDFERAMETIDKAENKEAISEGLKLIYIKFNGYLQQHGVKEISVIGELFDPETMEAVTTVPVSDTSQEDIVIDCIQKGYTLNDKVIRFPKVIVGK